MRLRTQLLLWALATAVLCGIFGTWLLGLNAQRSAGQLLQGELKAGEQALLRHWAARRAQRRSAYEAIARQNQLITSLSSGDRAQLTEVAKLARAAGADVVVIIDRAGTLLASEGNNAARLFEATTWNVLSESGSMIQLDGMLLDAIRTPIGNETILGFIVAANRLTSEQLRSDSEPLGLMTAIAIDGVVTSMLPPDLMTTARWGDDPSAQLPKLAERYQLRASTLGSARLLVAVPNTKVDAFTTEFIKQVSVVLLLILLAPVAVSLVLLERVSVPLERLKKASQLLGQGRLSHCRLYAKPLASRNDELGLIARSVLEAASKQHQVSSQSQKLLKQLEGLVQTIETVATGVVDGTRKQERCIEDLTGVLLPLTQALDATALGMEDAHSQVVSLSLSASATDQSHSMLTTAARRAEALLSNKSVEESRAVRTASVMQQVGAIIQLLSEQREALQKFRDQVNVLRGRIDQAIEGKPNADERSQQAQRMTQEARSLSQQQAVEADSLRTSAEILRGHLGELQKLVGTLELRPSDKSPTSATNKQGKDSDEVEPRSKRDAGSQRGTSAGGRPPQAGSRSDLGSGSSSEERLRASTASSSSNLRPVNLVGHASSSSNPQLSLSQDELTPPPRSAGPKTSGGHRTSGTLPTYHPGGAASDGTAPMHSGSHPKLSTIPKSAAGSVAADASSLEPSSRKRTGSSGARRPIQDVSDLSSDGSSSSTEATPVAASETENALGSRRGTSRRK